MGVPKFFRWLCERYPLLLAPWTEYTAPLVDNLYLDMNGLIHPCTHPNDVDPNQKQPSEDEIVIAIFQYIERIFALVKPRKYLVLCVDGVAPRAKMNQQRQRRFRSSWESSKERQRLIDLGQDVLDPEEAFDSNCITPGTTFMTRLSAHLKYWVAYKLNSDSLWQNCQVVFSGQEVPGEGEHKIMSFIRQRKEAEKYDPNEVHCIYGLDADLLMLALVSHEPHFVLLREEVNFAPPSRSKDKNKSRRLAADARSQKLCAVPKFQALHISLLREFLEIELLSTDASGGAAIAGGAGAGGVGNTRGVTAVEAGKAAGRSVSFERAVDDFVASCFLLGNDFLPHVAGLRIRDNGMPVLFHGYKTTLVTHGHITTEDSFGINWANLQAMCAVLADHERREYTQKLATDTSDLARMVPLKKTGAKGEATDDDIRRCYYARFFGADESDHFDVHAAAAAVVRDFCHGILWTFRYYKKGVPSWSWFFPHHFGPLVIDMADPHLVTSAMSGRPLRVPSVRLAEPGVEVPTKEQLASMEEKERRREARARFEVVQHSLNAIGDEIRFELGEPFAPYQQLLAVLPPASARLVPPVLRPLMLGGSTRLRPFYPTEEEVPMVRPSYLMEYEGTLVLPFFDERVLLEEYKTLLTKAEKDGKGDKECGGFTTIEKAANCEGSTYIYTVERTAAAAAAEPAPAAGGRGGRGGAVASPPPAAADPAALGPGLHEAVIADDASQMHAYTLSSSLPEHFPDVPNCTVFRHVFHLPPPRVKDAKPGSYGFKAELNPDSLIGSYAPEGIATLHCRSKVEWSTRLEDQVCSIFGMTSRTDTRVIHLQPPRLHGRLEDYVVNLLRGPAWVGFPFPRRVLVERIVTPAAEYAMVQGRVAQRPMLPQDRATFGVQVTQHRQALLSKLGVRLVAAGADDTSDLGRVVGNETILLYCRRFAGMETADGGVVGHRYETSTVAYPIHLLVPGYPTSPLYRPIPDARWQKHAPSVASLAPGPRGTAKRGARVLVVRRDPRVFGRVGTVTDCNPAAGSVTVEVDVEDGVDASKATDLPPLALSPAVPFGVRALHNEVNWLLNNEVASRLRLNPRTVTAIATGIFVNSRDHSDANLGLALYSPQLSTVRAGLARREPVDYSRMRGKEADQYREVALHGIDDHHYIMAKAASDHASDAVKSARADARGRGRGGRGRGRGGYDTAADPATETAVVMLAQRGRWQLSIGGAELVAAYADRFPSIVARVERAVQGEGAGRFGVEIHPTELTEMPEFAGLSIQEVISTVTDYIATVGGGVIPLCTMADADSLSLPPVAYAALEAELVGGTDALATAQTAPRTESERQALVSKPTTSCAVLNLSLGEVYIPNRVPPPPPALPANASRLDKLSAEVARSREGYAVQNPIPRHLLTPCKIGDRVVCALASGAVPFGAVATVTRVLPGKDVEIVTDVPFLSGTTLHSLLRTRRGAAVPMASVLTLPLPDDGDVAGAAGALLAGVGVDHPLEALVPMLRKMPKSAVSAIKKVKAVDLQSPVSDDTEKECATDVAAAAADTISAAGTPVGRTARDPLAPLSDESDTAAASPQKAKAKGWGPPPGAAAGGAKDESPQGAAVQTAAFKPAPKAKGAADKSKMSSKPSPDSPQVSPPTPAVMGKKDPPMQHLRGAGKDVIVTAKVVDSGATAKPAGAAARPQTAQASLAAPAAAAPKMTVSPASPIEDPALGGAVRPSTAAAAAGAQTRKEGAPAPAPGSIPEIAAQKAAGGASAVAAPAARKPVPAIPTPRFGGESRLRMLQQGLASRRSGAPAAVPQVAAAAPAAAAPPLDPAVAAAGGRGRSAPAGGRGGFVPAGGAGGGARGPGLVPAILLRKRVQAEQSQALEVPPTVAPKGQVTVAKLGTGSGDAPDPSLKVDTKTAIPSSSTQEGTKSAAEKGKAKSKK